MTNMGMLFFTDRYFYLLHFLKIKKQFQVQFYLQNGSVASTSLIIARIK